MKTHFLQKKRSKVFPFLVLHMHCLGAVLGVKLQEKVRPESRKCKSCPMVPCLYYTTCLKRSTRIAFETAHPMAPTR